MRFSVAAALAVAAIALVAAGCGGGSSSSSSASSAASTSTSTSTTKSPPAGKTSSAPEFTKKELDGFGTEASQSELEAASAVLAENLKARESKNWATQCATLTAGVKKVLAKEGFNFGSQPGCAARLAEQAPGAPAILFKDTLSGQITALRLKKDSAVAVFHGNDGKNYAMEMKEEGGEWKVDSLLLILLP